MTRSAAIRRQEEMVLALDVQHRHYTSAVVPIRHMPDDISAELKFASVEQTNASAGAFRFFPDGSSTGGEIILSIGRHKERICVDWLTGWPDTKC
jgi:general secretion pathway protein H